jgi:hypothetical protein
MSPKHQDPKQPPMNADKRRYRVQQPLVQLLFGIGVDQGSTAGNLARDFSDESGRLSKAGARPGADKRGCVSMLMAASALILSAFICVHLRFHSGFRDSF